MRGVGAYQLVNGDRAMATMYYTCTTQWQSSGADNNYVLIPRRYGNENRTHSLRTQDALSPGKTQVYDF